MLSRATRALTTAAGAALLVGAACAAAAAAAAPAVGRVLQPGDWAVAPAPSCVTGAAAGAGVACASLAYATCWAGAVVDASTDGGGCPPGAAPAPRPLQPARVTLAVGSPTALNASADAVAWVAATAGGGVSTLAYGTVLRLPAFLSADAGAYYALAAAAAAGTIGVGGLAVTSLTLVEPAPAPPVVLAVEPAPVNGTLLLVARRALARVVVVADAFPRADAAWMVDGVDVSGTRAAQTEGDGRYVLTLRAPAAGSVNVTFTLTNALGTAAAAVNVTAGDAPIVGVTERAVLAAVGQPAALAVALLSGTQPLSFSWTRPGGAVIVTDAPLLALPAVSAASDDGEYTVTVTNPLGTSAPVHVTLVVVSSPPVVVADLPSARTAVSGDAVRLAVSVRGRGLTALQWWAGGALLASHSPDPLADAVNASIVWPQVGTTDAAAAVSFVAVNAAGTTASASLALTVAPPPWRLECEPVVAMTMPGAQQARAVVGATVVVDSAACAPLSPVRRASLGGGGGAAVAVLDPADPARLPECTAPVTLLYELVRLPSSLPAACDGWNVSAPSDAVGNFSGAARRTAQTTLSFEALPALASAAACAVTRRSEFTVVLAAVADGGALAGVRTCAAPFVLYLPTPSSVSPAAQPPPSPTQPPPPVYIPPGWNLVPTPEPTLPPTPTTSPTASATPSLTASASVTPSASASQLPPLVDGWSVECASIDSVAVGVGVALGAIAAAVCIASLAYADKQRAASAAPPLYLRATVVPLTSYLATFARHASGWDIVAAAQFIALTDALGVPLHPAYDVFAGTFAPALLYVSGAGPRASACDGRGGPLSFSPLQAAFDTAHAVRGEALQRDAAPAPLPTTLFSTSTERDSAALSMVLGGAASVPRLSAHPAVASGDLTLLHATTATVLTVALGVALLAAVALGRLATGAVTRRFRERKHTVAVAWDATAALLAVVSLVLVAVAAPGAMLAAAHSWRLAASPLSSGVGAGAVVVTTLALLLAVFALWPLSVRPALDVTARPLTAAAALWCAAGLPLLIVLTAATQPTAAAAVIAGTLIVAAIGAAVVSRLPSVTPNDGGRAVVVASGLVLQSAAVAALGAAAASADGDPSDRLQRFRLAARAAAVLLTMSLAAAAILALHAWRKRRRDAVAAGLAALASSAASALSGSGSGSYEHASSGRQQHTVPAASADRTAKTVTVPVPVDATGLGLNRSLLGGASPADVVGAVSYWALSHRVVAVYALADVPAGRARDPRSQLRDVLPTRAAPPDRPLRAEVAVQQQLRRLSSNGASRLPSPRPSPPPPKRRRQIVYRTLSAPPPAAQVLTPEARFVASLLRNRPQAAAARVAAVETAGTLQLNQRGGARRRDDDEPAVRVGMGPTRLRRQHAAPYAPHLGAHLPDGFFDFGGAADTAGDGRAASAGNGADDDADGDDDQLHLRVSSRSRRSLRHSSATPRTPRFAASPLALDEVVVLPSSRAALGESLPPSAHTPTAAYSPLTAARVVPTAPSLAESFTRQLYRPTRPRGAQQQQPQPQRRGSMAAFIVDSVQALASAMQRAVASSSGSSGGSGGGAPLSAVSVHAPPPAAAGSAAGSGGGDDDDVVHVNPMLRQQPPQPSQQQPRPAARAAAPAGAAGVLNPLSALAARRPEPQPQPQSASTTSPSSLSARQPTGSLPPARRGGEAAWRGRDWRRGPLYAYRPQPAVVAGGSGGSIDGGRHPRDIHQQLRNWRAAAGGHTGTTYLGADAAPASGSGSSAGRAARRAQLAIQQATAGGRHQRQRAEGSESDSDGGAGGEHLTADPATPAAAAARRKLAYR